MIELDLFQMYHLKEMSLSTEIFLSCSILQLTFYAVGTAYQRKQGFVILSNQIYNIALLILSLSAFLILNEDLFSSNVLINNNFIINDFLSFGSKLTIILISSLFLLIVKISYRDELIYNNFEYIVLITISVLGLLLLCSSNDLITAYLSIELHSVAFYLMAAFKKNSSYSIESGLKYFIIGALSSAFFLFGSAILYGCLGTLNFDDFRTLLTLLSQSREFTAFLTLFLPIVFTSVEVEEKPLLIGFDNCVSSSSSKIEANSLDLSFIESYTAQLNIPSNSILTENYSQLMESRFIDTHFWVTEFEFKDVNSQDFLSNALNCLKLTDFFNVNLSELNVVDFNLIYIGFFLICISIFIKLALAPFHLWSLDVYEGSPNSTTAFFAVIPKIALFVLLARLCYSSFYELFNVNYQNYFVFLAVLSIFVGSVGGLEQRNLKTLLAYSSVSHTGYLFLAFNMNTAESFQMMFYYLVIFMISGLCFWSVYLFIKQNQKFYYKKHNKELGDFVLLKESNPTLALILVMTLFSIAGIPPLIGFLAKVGVFLVTIESSAYLVAVISILLSVISTFYYIRMIKVLYFENSLVGKLYYPISTNKALVISFLALSLIILCLNPTFIYLVFYKASLLIYS
jgi:NADH:ubiquinone oxidoreductase subunit 2 (subunit N)